MPAMLMFLTATLKKGTWIECASGFYEERFITYLTCTTLQMVFEQQFVRDGELRRIQMLFVLLQLCYFSNNIIIFALNS